MTYDLIKLSEVDSLDQKTVQQLYMEHVNIGIPKFLGMLGFDRYRPVRAEGMDIQTACGKTIHDYTGGISVLGLGHNHPRIMEARRRFNEERRMEVWKAFLSPYLAALSKNLAALCPGDLNVPFFCNSGAEANEGALKVCEKYQGPERRAVVYAHNSFHGKTHMAMSVSGCEDSRKHFKLLDGCLPVTYGDHEALEALVHERGGKANDICAVILEAIHAEGVIRPPAGYLREVRRICDENGILLIIDEVFCGFGRTGRMFAFEHDGIVPDVVTVSKSLGGGKASIAAYVTREPIYRKAYGEMKDAMMHTTTFNGLGEECWTAIEALNVLVDENLVENAREMGDYFLSRLQELAEKYPSLIRGVRGAGLILCIELQKPGKAFMALIGKAVPFIRDFWDGILTGILMFLLMDRHDILVFAGQHDKGSIMVNPSLIIDRERVDYFIKSLDELLSHGLMGLGTLFAKRKLATMRG